MRAPLALALLALAPAAGAETAIDTGVGAEAPVRFEPPSPRLGELLVVYAFAPDGSTARAELEVFGYETTMHKVSADTLRAVLAVPVDIEPKRYPVRIALPDRSLTAELVIADRAFDASKLRVSRRFTDRPRPSIQRRMKRESRAWDLLWRAPPSRPKFIGAVGRPVPGEVTAVFGTKRMYNGRLSSRHYGLDLEAKTGEDVVAAQAGLVVMSADRFVSGGTIVIDHGGGLFSAYFHLVRRLPKVGEWVEAGELIGAAGATGRVTGPHLHLAVLVRQVEQKEGSRLARGLFADPAAFLRLELAGDLQFVEGPPARRQKKRARR